MNKKSSDILIMMEVRVKQKTNILIKKKNFNVINQNKIYDFI